MRIIFMGTPAFALPALSSLISSMHEVVGVYSQPPRPAGRGMKLTASPVHQLAEKHTIPVFTPTSLKSPEAQAEFANHNADIAVVAAYGLLLPQAILDAPRLGCINIHPSDLPRWRGAAPIQRTIMAGDTNTACCIMQMDSGLDTGPVLAREAYAIPDSMNAGELHDAIADIGARMVLNTLKSYELCHPGEGQDPCRDTPQNDDMDSGRSLPRATTRGRDDTLQGPIKIPQSPTNITYAAKITKTDQSIDWSQPASVILNQIRGLCPSPGAVTTLNGETIKIFAARIEQGDATKPLGLTLDNQLLINAENGSAVRILELQRPGKTRQPVAEFLKSYPVAVGTRLGEG